MFFSNKNAAIKKAVADIAEPNLGCDLQSANVIADIKSGGDGCDICLQFPYPAKRAFDDIAEQIRRRLASINIGNARVTMKTKIAAHTVQGGVERVRGVSNIVAVASAKGGVGKSTTAVNLALALAKEGATVGMLDADVYGPSLPTMLDIRHRPDATDGKIEPIIKYDLRLMSVGFMVDDDQPMVWRGPIATRTLTQLLRETNWGGVDYLILDMPPGTGDIQLTIAQTAPLTGAIIVTTPQDLALADAQKGLVMFNKVSIPVLGIVENMSVHICEKCGHSSHIFGAGGAQKMAAKYDVEVLGKLPLAADIRAAADAGMPTVLSSPNSPVAENYRKIAVRIGVKIAQKSRDRSVAFPKIVVSNK